MSTSLKDRVLAATDIVDVIGQHVSLKRQGREFVGLCPFHNDHHPSMRVSPAKQIFKCFSCGAGGDVIKFIQLRQRVEFRDALRVLAERAGIAPDEDDAAARANAATRERARSVLAWAAKHFQRNLHETPAGNAALEYARRRGMTDETIRAFGLGLAPDAWSDLFDAASRARVAPNDLFDAGLISRNDAGRTYDRFRNRLIFPIADPQARVIAFGGRTLGDDPAKYLNSPETALFSKSRVLYGFDCARDAIIDQRAAIVVEGYTDVILLHQAGVTHTVAALGTAMTDAHARLLVPLADTLYMCFDSDEAGHRAADRAVEVALRQQADVRVVLMPAGQDPADCVAIDGPDEFQKLLDAAQPALEFKWRTTLDAYESGSQRGRRDALDAYLQFVASAGAAGGIDPLDQGLLISRLADLLALPADTIYERLAQLRRRSRPRESTNTDAAAVPDRPLVSDYESAIAGIPGGIAAAVEELFGLALTNPALLPDAERGLAVVAAFANPWRRLYELLCRISDREESWTQAVVLAECDDPLICDLIERAVRRAAFETENVVDLCAALAKRVTDELERRRAAELSAALRRPIAGDHAARDAFEAIADVARRRHNVLGLGHSDA